ncbi:MAG: phosphatase PAP2 family protein [Bryobacteraceae bacterium]
MGSIAIRRSEWVLIAYFAYVAALARVLPAKDPIPTVTLWLNATILAAYFLVAYADSLRRRPLLGVLRDWYPMPLIMLAYREMGWLAPATHSYGLERVWVRWDKFFLNDLGVKTMIEAVDPVVPSLLEISYTLVYATPFIALAVLYAYGKRDRADRFLFPFALSVLCAYALFPYFPSEPPRAVFPGEDFPSYVTVFRRFNWAMLGSYGIHTSVFPSAHVSGAFSAAFTLRYVLPERKWPWRFLLVLAILIATATVYGRYHYLADAAAGLAIALAVYGFAFIRRSRQATASVTPG